MHIELWGVRGSTPAPAGCVEYRLKLREILFNAVQKKISQIEDIEHFISSLPENLQYFYGGNTTCVSAASSTGMKYIFDCGSGIRTLGDILMRGDAGKGKAEIHIFITHTHWDHIQGLPFFKPLYIPGNVVHFYSGIPDLHDRLRYQQTERFFPKDFDAMDAKKIFHLLEPGEKIFLENDLSLDCFPLKHPGGSMSYRLTNADKVFVFATDAEFTGDYLESFTAENDAFFSNADLLLIDSQYTLDEAFKKFDWGHTSYTMAVNCALRWHAKKLVLTHHEPAYYDEKLFSIFNSAVEHRDAMESKELMIHMAREGMSFDL